MDKNTKINILELKENRKYNFKQIIVISIYILTNYISINLTTIFFFKIILNCAIVCSTICALKKITNIIIINKKIKKYLKEQQIINNKINTNKNIEKQKLINPTNQNNHIFKKNYYNQNYNIEKTKSYTKKKSK